MLAYSDSSSQSYQFEEASQVQVRIGEQTFSIGDEKVSIDNMLTEPSNVGGTDRPLLNVYYDSLNLRLAYDHTEQRLVQIRF